MADNYNKKMKEEMFALKQHVNDGARPVVVINKEVFEECYLEPNMRARLVSLNLSPLCEPLTGAEDEEIVFRFTLDFAEFHESNKVFAEPSWLDKNGQPTLTAEEAGYRPENDRLVYDHRITSGSMFFDLEDEGASELFSKYQLEMESAHVQVNYTTWLEQKLLSMQSAKQLEIN
ncbi:hypothetical protein [Vibrio sp. D431a]|uniref:hypothetical protein n=1 Tax=Vibrio sp. D431a TaxID=2837388 RepID=UPI0025522708|nr:hypothetical protein [Vibrio sp. D431a]MDK9789784.1 hypothetical protein [Vibrio sp. D431a]